MKSIFLILLFLVSPFTSMVSSFAMLYKSKLSEKEVTICLVIISMFWGILAFSQKSLAIEDTDCIRYYQNMEQYEYMDPIEAINSINIIELLNYVFYPISITLVSVTGNVQTISFLWTFLVYILTYTSIRRLLEYYNFYEHKKFTKIIFICTFCFMAFVQISELQKNSAAFAVFFYALTLYITKKNYLVVIALVFVSIGLHSSTIMLLPLFLYRYLNTKYAIIIGIIFFALSTTTNVINLLMEILPSGGYFDLLLDRFGSYGTGQTGTSHYIAIQLTMLLSAIYLWLKNKKNNKELTNAVNIIFLYFIISNLNFYNLTAYLRFSIFSHWLFALILIWFVQASVNNLKFRQVKNILVFFMLLMTIRWTLARTITGNYCSSYMDNSITKIVFSTMNNYLSEDYEK